MDLELGRRRFPSARQRVDFYYVSHLIEAVFSVKIAVEDCSERFSGAIVAWKEVFRRSSGRVKLFLDLKAGNGSSRGSAFFSWQMAMETRSWQLTAQVSLKNVSSPGRARRRSRRLNSSGKKGAPIAPL